jgi:hypothetical protein
MSETTSTPAASLSGGCLCGNVRFEARPDQREGYYCHCRMCQLAVGNTRAAFINLQKDQVTWTATEPTYFASSKIAKRGFCGKCGSPISFEYLTSLRMDLTVGTFDDPSALKPVSHFAIESRIANWYCDDGLPGDRMDESPALAKRWKESYGDDVVPGPEISRGA